MPFKVVTVELLLATNGPTNDPFYKPTGHWLYLWSRLELLGQGATRCHGSLIKAASNNMSQLVQTGDVNAQVSHQTAWTDGSFFMMITRLLWLSLLNLTCPIVVLLLDEYRNSLFLQFMGHHLLLIDFGVELDWIRWATKQLIICYHKWLVRLMGGFFLFLTGFLH